MEYNKAILDFYTDFYKDADKARDLMDRCYIFTVDYTIDTDENLTELAPRRVVNNISRLMSYSDKLLSTGSHNVHVFFWITCIESVCYIPSESSGDKKHRIIKRFFKENILADDQKFLIENIKPTLEIKNFNMEDIASVFYSLRNSFTHEGDIYFYFPLESSDSFTIQNISKGNSIMIRATYTEIRSIFMRAYLNYLERLICLAENAT
ncbi:hypothetical protein [Paenibacillus sp. Leaf72]|uniref:hypothetical protein n=1 Tax=Paenibacillus sp. Leaf72 TaxID=1736234 RepID=UPI0006F5EA4F|nr:hypothetical protein [Paenibacillus sp. Leaf72]KQN97601.1 hypothetical protein ASF12_20525 [Paenibacillus sp. Leaf72]